MEVRVLGPVELAIGGVRLEVGGPRAQAVLALLTVRAGEVLTADWLIDQLWGERPPRAARIALQSYISRLRRLVVPDSERLVPRHPRGYSLNPAVVDIDASRFIRLSGQGRVQVAATQWREALKSLRSV